MEEGLPLTFVASIYNTLGNSKKTALTYFHSKHKKYNNILNFENAQRWDL